MPKLNKKEKKSDYISRCIKEVMQGGGDQKAAVGKCYGMWDYYKKKSKASVETDDGDEILIDPED